MRTFGHVCSAKIQISLRFRAVRTESSLHIFWIAKYATFFHANNEDSDLTFLMRRLCFLRCAQMPEGMFSHVVAHIVTAILASCFGDRRFIFQTVEFTGLVKNKYARNNARMCMFSIRCRTCHMIPFHF